MSPKHERAHVGEVSGAGFERAPAPRAIGGRATGDEEPGLAEYLADVVEHRFLVLSVLLGALVLAVAYLVLVPPTYRSSVLLQVEDRTKGIAGLDELQAVLGDRTPADTEIEIIRSWSVMGAVVDQLKLTIETRPRTFPVIGGAIFRRFRGSGIARPLPGLSSFAWGGERIRVTQFDVPEALLDEEFRIVALDADRFQLRGPKGDMLLEGHVGRAAEVGQGDARIAVVVSDMKARPGAQFRVSRRWRDDVIDDLEKKLDIGEKGKKTGIITVALDGKDMREVAAIVDAVAQNFQRQNVQRRSEEAAKTLDFIQDQLPILKGNLDAAERALNAYQLKKGSVAVSRETEDVLDRAVDIEKTLTEMDLQRAELSQRFAREHPMLVAAKEKIDRMRAERAAIDAKLRALPAQELESARLERDVKVANELYFLLINKAQELRLLKSGTIGSVRMLDTARGPHEPVSPKPILVLALALFLGVAGGIGVAIAKESLTQAVHDPEDIEGGLGLPVYASVPHSQRQDQLTESRPRGTPFQVLASTDPSDLAVEGIRSLRTALQFALAEARNNVIAVAGPSPGVGKSFLSVNLAHVLASMDKRVLLVDCDLRRGRLHRFFGVERGPGLSELVSGQAPAKDVVQKGQHENVFFLATGKVPPNPSELLASSRFQRFIEEASEAYDLVVIDTPPILAVTDAAIVGRHSGVNLLVVRFGKHPLGEIALAIKRFSGAGVRVNGTVLNDVPTGRGRYGYHYGYHYALRSDSADA